jgi:hypothetical protein
VSGKKIKYFQKNIQKGEYYGTKLDFNMYANLPIILKGLLILSQIKSTLFLKNQLQIFLETANLLFQDLLPSSFPLQQVVRVKVWTTSQVNSLGMPDAVDYGLIPMPYIAALLLKPEKKCIGKFLKISFPMLWTLLMTYGPKARTIYGMVCLFMQLMGPSILYLPQMKIAKSLTLKVVFNTVEKGTILNVWFPQHMMYSDAFL